MKKILVIEDEVQIRDIFLECLEAEGFDAIGAENGLVGVQRAQEQLPDLVICDIKMPQLDGYGVLTTLRHNPITAIIPFIFITVKTAEAERCYGMELGADDYLNKPCTAEDLLRAIAKVCELTGQSNRRDLPASGVRSDYLPIVSVHQQLDIRGSHEKDSSD